ncbi:MAG: proliferating cell nuclear antigen (pcna) [Candidatus Hodarchaeota archaeon]
MMAKKKPIQTKGFTIKKETSKILKGIIETLASIIDEAKFQITPSEFIVEAMDPSRICLLNLTIKKGDFDEYQCAEEVHIGLNLDDLDKILKRSNANDSIELSFEAYEQKIKVKMKRQGSTRTRTFSLALLDVDIEEIPMENLLKIEYKTNWKMDTEFFVEAIKDAEIYSEILNLKAIENEGLNFSSSGQIGEMNYELDIDDLIESDIKDSASGAYSLTFLKSILKISTITEKLSIFLKSDHPLKMIFDLLEGGKLFYFLAPRVDSEAEYDDDDEEVWEETNEAIEEEAT